jgi:hypothetical protein
VDDKPEPITSPTAQKLTQDFSVRIGKHNPNNSVDWIHSLMESPIIDFKIHKFRISPIPEIKKIKPRIPYTRSVLRLPESPT